MKIFLRWYINENYLKKQKEISKIQKSAIVIIVKKTLKQKKPCVFGLWFRGVVRVVERY